MFKASGVLVVAEFRVPVNITWKEGAFTIDNEAADAILRVRWSLQREVLVVPGIVKRGEEMFSDPNGAYALLLQELEDVEIVEGQVPPLPEVPEGAVS